MTTIRQGDEVRQLHGGRLGVVRGIWTIVRGGREARGTTHELCVQWDDGAASWCGEADVETTGYNRDAGKERSAAR